MVHLDATVLLQSKTPSHILDSGLRDALGRHAGTLQNLVSIESSKPIRDRLYLALTGTTAHTPLHCILCDMDTIDNNEHARVCPALVHHRQLRFLLMAEAFASIGDTLHHNTTLRFSPTISQCEHVIRTCSRTQIEPFHEHTPIHTLPQIRVLPPDAANTQRVGIWRLETEHKRVLQGVIITPRAHIMAALAIHFAPTIDTSHAIVPTMEHTLAHSELYQFIRLIPPSFLQWLIQEFDIKG